MLRPLEQFICDKCHQIIEEPEHGWVEWESTISGTPPKQQQWGFKIVHHKAYSPLRDEYGRSCYHYDNSPHRSDLHLRDFLESGKMAELLSFLDIGPYHEPNYNGPSVVNMREFVEFTRRLTIPYYEEARRYWGKALSDGYFDGANEIWVYLPGNLQALIEKYRNR